jgi:branched-chain amino acid transport system permease protein
LSLIRRPSPWWLLILLIPVVTAPFVHGYYQQIVAATVAIDAFAAIGLAITLQKTGQPSLAQTTFMAVGAYTAGLLELNAHWPLLPAAIAGIVLAGVSAWVVGAILLNLEGLYFALGTLALNAAVISILTNSAFFGNASGLQGLTRLHLGALVPEQTMTIVGWLAVLIGLVVAQRIDRSRLGRGMRMLRESLKVTQSVGFDPASLKRTAFAISGAYAGAAGVLMTMLFGIVNPGLFAIGTSISLVTMVIAGGEALAGTVAGAVVIVLVHEGTRSALQYAPVTLIGGIDLIVNGLVLIAILRLWPGGLTALAESIAPKRERTFAVPPARELAPIEASDGPIVAARGIRHHFGGVYAVDDVGLQVSPGKIVAVIGPNGAGKTTLLSILAGFLELQEGEIAIDGISIADLPAYARARRGIATTFQHIEVVQRMSVAENVLATGTREDAVLRSLAAVELIDVADREVSALSFGQQRMVELARVLARDETPRVLLMDEPASGLSQVERQTLENVIRRFARAGTAVVLVEHDVGFVARIADHILCLNYGVELAEGPPEELLRLPVVIEAYVGKAFANS